jgi:hypothetical protein
MDSKTESTGAQPTVEAGDDEFLASLRLDQSYTEAAVGVRKVLGTVPVRKPNKTDFFRVHPAHSLDCFAVELKEEREVYFITPALAQMVVEFCEPVRLRLCVTRQATAFLWPIKLPKEDRRVDEWRRSAAEAAHLAETRWIRLAADMHLGAYQTFEAVADLGDPRWPSEPWAEVVKVALRDRRIDSEDHAVIRQLLGHA